MTDVEAAWWAYFRAEEAQGRRTTEPDEPEGDTDAAEARYERSVYGD